MKKIDLNDPEIIRQYNAYAKYDDRKLTYEILHAKVAIGRGMEPYEGFEEEMKETLAIMKLVKCRNYKEQSQNSPKLTNEEKKNVESIIAGIENAFSAFKPNEPMFIRGIEEFNQLYGLWLIGILPIENWHQVVRFNALAITTTNYNRTDGYKPEMLEPEEVLVINPSLEATKNEYDKLYQPSGVTR